MSYITQRGLVLIKKYHLDLEKYRKELRVKPIIHTIYGKETSFDVYLENETKMYLPLVYGLEKFGNDITRFENKIPKGQPIQCIFEGELREQQIEPANITLESLRNENKRGGILQLPTGFGKTCLAIYIACQMKVKTIILVNKEFLLNQWKDRIKQFVPTARIGKIQQNTFDIENKDFVLAMVQTISQRPFPLNAFVSFGMMISDEVHNLGAEGFSKCLFKVGCRYRIGLSATPNRADGLSDVFKWHLGGIIYSKKLERKGLKPVVDIYRYENKEAKELMNINKEPNIPVMVTETAKNQTRNGLIIDLLIKHASEGRNILVLSERVNHLKDLYKMYSESPVSKEYPGGLYIGETCQIDREKASDNASVLFGTLRLVQEGFDQPKLNTLVYALFNGGPIKTRPDTDKVIRQTTGRIFRKVHNETCPLIIDVQDTHSVFKNQGYRRAVYYKDEKMKVNLFKVKQTTNNYTIKKSKCKETKITKFLINEME